MATSSHKTTSATSAARTQNTRQRRLDVIAGLMVLVGLISGGAGYLLGSSHVLKHGDEAARAETPILVPLEPFTVNLKSDDGRNRFLHIGLSVKAADERSQKQAMQYLPEVRSRVLILLSNRQADSLAAPGDRTRLAAEVLQALNKPLAPDQVPPRFTDVAFTTFMIQ